MEPPSSFGTLLRRHRLAAGLSQGKLAEEAGLSLRGVADLERGVRRFPYRETIGRLADALGLDADDRAALLAAGQRPTTPPQPRPERPAAPEAPPVTAPMPHPTSSGQPRALVGRANELRQLEGALQAALAGHGRTVLVAGEAGIGKTRLSQELAVRAEALGARVHASACLEDDSAPAFWPWLQLIRGHLRATHTADDAGLLQKLGAATPHRSVRLTEYDRFWLFDAVAQFWVRAATSQPTLLILEDLHWSDPSSLLLLRFIATQLRDAPLLLVGSYRDVELPRDHLLRQLAAEITSDHQHVRLTGLAEPEVAELLELLTGHSSGGAMVASLHKQSGGNPLFVRELVQLLPSATVETWPTQVVRTSGVRSLIQRRLSRLSGRCAELLSVMAVIGSHVDAALLQAVVGPSMADLRTVLDEALRSGLLSETADPAGGYHFTHSLVRDVLYAEISPTERAALHERVAAAISQQPGRGEHAPADELAYHYLRVVLDSGAQRERAVEHTERAGWQALTALAYEAAAGHFRQALRLVDPADAHRRSLLLLALGRALMGASDLTAARAAYQEAAALARSLHAPDVLVQAALEVGMDFTTGLVDEVQVRLLEEALSVLGEADSTQRARLQARLAAALRFSPGAERRRQLSAAAVTLARQLGDPATLARVLLDVHLANWDATTAETRLAMASESIALAEQSGDEVLALEGRSLRLGDQLDLGAIRAFRLETETYERLVQTLRQARLRWQVPLLQATLATLDASFDEAEQLIGLGLRLGRQAQQEGALEAAPAVFSALRFAQGRAVELEAVVRERLRLPTALPAWRAVLAYVLCEAGKDAEARVEFDLLAADNFGRIPRDSTWACNLALLALSAARLGDVRRAEVLYQLVLPFEPYIARPTRFGGGCLGSMAHYAGLLAATLEDWDSAVRHFETAIQVHARLGAKALVANSHFHLARALRARGATGDAARATNERAHAEAAARVLGIHFHLQHLPDHTPSPARR